MVMPERLPTPLPAPPEVAASTASAAWVVAVPLAASSAFTALPKRRSFTAHYKLRILAETDRATRRLGRAIWRRWGGYHRRSLVEIGGGPENDPGDRFPGD